MVMTNKNHWYDGFIYDKFIAPNQDKSFQLVKEIIHQDAKVIDVGCGTGRMEFQLSDKCDEIIGLDLSERNINLAVKNKLKYSYSENVKFIHDDVLDFFNETELKFDYAVMSYVIHEIDIDLRTTILRKMIEKSENIILVDYLVPQDNFKWKIINEIVEFAAGRDHYKNYKSYQKNGGLRTLAEQAQLKIIKEISGNPVSSQILVLSN